MLHTYRVCIGVAVYEIELLGVQAPFHKFRDAFLVEPIGWEKEMAPHDVQRTRPDSRTPVM